MSTKKNRPDLLGPVDRDGEDVCWQDVTLADIRNELVKLQVSTTVMLSVPYGGIERGDLERLMRQTLKARRRFEQLRFRLQFLITNFEKLRIR